MRQVDEMVRERMRERKRFCFLFFLGRGGVDEEEAKKGGGGGEREAGRDGSSTGSQQPSF